MDALRARSLAALTRIEGVAKFRFRRLRPEAKDEKVTGTFAIAWKNSPWSGRGKVASERPGEVGRYGRQMPEYGL